jgi:DNA-binding transcriptional ArsR family regulator
MARTDRPRHGGEADFATPAGLIGHPARSAMLLALLDGRALPMSTLAAEAGIAVSTASAHLTQLTEGGLLVTRRQGRHRYYALASAQVVKALEELAKLAAPRPVRSLRESSRAYALRLARTCYDHIAGRLGVALMRSLLDQDALTGGDGLHHPSQTQHDRLSAPGRDVDYRLTSTGQALFSRLGVEISTGRRRLVAYCVDWTEQRHHLGGALGAALLERLVDLDWIHRGETRALRITDAGRKGLADHFDIAFDPQGAGRPPAPDVQRTGSVPG